MRKFWHKQQVFLWSFLLIWILLASLVFQIEKGEDIEFVMANRQPLYNSLFRLASALAEEWVFLLLILIAVMKKYRLAIALLFVALASLLLSYLLKQYFYHPRPATYFIFYLNQPDLIAPVPGMKLLKSAGGSFPSGHTTAGFALYALLAFYVRAIPLKLLGLLLALSVGLSRVYLAQHFLEDVLAGAVLGVFIAILGYSLFLFLKKYDYLDQGLLKA